MAVLWCGGEDIDFQGTVTSLTTAGTHYRTGYARAGISSNAATSYLKSLTFPGGAITSGWLSFRTYGSGGSLGTTQLILGFVGSSTTNSGLYVGTSAVRDRCGLYTFDGATKVLLAVEAGNSLVYQQINRVDVQLVSYGAAATVNVYVNGVLVIAYGPGDVRISGLTSVDCLGLNGWTATVNQAFSSSEIIVADEDPRAFPGLVTLALTGDGTTTDWTGTFSTINQVVISDDNPNYSNTNNQLQQFDVTNLPAGTFTIKAVKLAMRAAKAAGTSTQIALGYDEGGTVTVESDIALTAAYATYEQLDVLNPRTSTAWSQSIMNALQIAAKSRA